MKALTTEYTEKDTMINKKGKNFSSLYGFLCVLNSFERVSND